MSRIEPEGMTDVAVWEDDHLTMPMESIREAKAWGTELSGKVLPAREIKP